MARKIYPYSLDRKDAKVAGVASTIGGMTGIDPTIIRLGFDRRRDLHQLQADPDRLCRGRHLSSPCRRSKALKGDRRMSDFDRMDQAARRRPTTHVMVNDLDQTDRRLMAIDHHIKRRTTSWRARSKRSAQEEK